MGTQDGSSFPTWQDIRDEPELLETCAPIDGETMTPRERFRAAMAFEEVDRLPMVTMGLWPETEERWRGEGATDIDAEAIRGFDGPMQSCWMYGKYQGPIPAFEEKVIAETERYRDEQNWLGQVQRTLIDSTSMPSYLEFPLKGRSDWNEYRKRLDPTSPGRYPENWDVNIVERRRGPAADEIRGVAVYGYYGFPRMMFGTEQLSMLFYDEPELIAEMNEYWCEFSMSRLEKAMKEMDFDYALIWEDNCYNHGMLHSPKVFGEFMAPYYRRLVEFFRGAGIDIISVDSDGNVAELIPLLLDVGVTGLHPFEVASGMDVVEIARQYPRLQMWGGLDKREIAKGPLAIDAELDRVLPFMKKRGGYAAGLDHSVPPDVSLVDHRYYVENLRRRLLA